MAVSALVASLSWVGLQLAVSALAAACMGGSRMRNVMGASTAVAGLLVPALAPTEATTVRMIMALFSILSLMRAFDLMVDRRQWSLRRRLWLFVGVIDSRQLERCSPYLDFPALLLLGLTISLGVLAFLGATLVSAGAPWPWLLWRWGCGAAMCYMMPDGAQQLLRLFYHGLGVRVPELHRNPVLATSVREFWGERWNLLVHDWLRRHCFLRFARRRQRALGTFAAFIASAAIHAWSVLVALDFSLAVAMAAFFTVQGVVVWFELAIGMPLHRATTSAHIWTIAAVLVPSPLFVEPALRVLEGWMPQLSNWANTIPLY